MSGSYFVHVPKNIELNAPAEALTEPYSLTVVPRVPVEKARQLATHLGRLAPGANIVVGEQSSVVTTISVSAQAEVGQVSLPHPRSLLPAISGCIGRITIAPSQRGSEFSVRATPLFEESMPAPIPDAAFAAVRVRGQALPKRRGSFLLPDSGDPAR